jgi:uncharacterized protein (TIGR03435 family)
MSTRRRHLYNRMRVLTILTASLLAGRAFSQPAPDALVFDAASIKPNTSLSGHSSSRVTNGEVIMRNVSLKGCIQLAYHLADGRLFGPDWLSTTRFDIVAKPPSGSPHDQYRQMMQALLADRFKLAIHHESRMLPAFALVVGKNGPKLQKGEPGGPHVDTENTKMTGRGMTMANLAETLSQHLDRPVVDKTGLDGFFDLHLEWSPEEKPSDEKSAAAAQPPTGPSIFTAVQEQLGLKLQAEKLPIDVVVVDHIEREPTEN